MTSFYTFASGSGGNCSLYINGDACILIDAGTTTKYIRTCLGQLGMTLGDLTHVLITHGHNDHVSALPVLGRHTSARLVCSHDTYYALSARWDEPLLFTPGQGLELSRCPVNTFATPHDAPGSCGFVLGEGRDSLAYCTDLGTITAQVYYAIEGNQTVFIESNHDGDMLRWGPYPAYLKRRIASGTGHLSNEMCAKTVAALCKSGTKSFILGHLSGENNTPRLALEANRRALQALGPQAAGWQLAVAPAVGITRPVTV